MNAAARFDESASATGSSMRPRGLFDGPFRAGPAQERPARAGRVGGTTGRDSRHGPALSSGRASPALMISCWAVFWAPVFGPCSGWPSWARPIFPALSTITFVAGEAREQPDHVAQKSAARPFPIGRFSASNELGAAALSPRVFPPCDACLFTDVLSPGESTPWLAAVAG